MWTTRLEQHRTMKTLAVDGGICLSLLRIWVVYLLKNQYAPTRADPRVSNPRTPGGACHYYLLPYIPWSLLANFTLTTSPKPPNTLQVVPKSQTSLERRRSRSINCRSQRSTPSQKVIEGGVSLQSSLMPLPREISSGAQSMGKRRQRCLCAKRSGFSWSTIQSQYNSTITLLI